MKPKTLKLNGKPLDLNPPSPIVSKVIAFLDKSGDDELFTLDQIAEKTSVSLPGLSFRARGPEFVNYREKVARSYYYGNPAAITELRKQVNQ